MDRDSFLAYFAAACHALDVSLFGSVPTAYPIGDRIRVKYCRAGLPASLDPLQTVWLDRYGVIASLLDYHNVGASLGLAPADVEALARAADCGLDACEDPEVRAWRVGLLVVVERLPIRGPFTR